jgi:uncharacterized protein (TIGR00369 family)
VKPRTHLLLDRRWSGTPVELREGAAVVRMAALPEMAADEAGLVHGGFLFALADHAAMLAVNDPNVLLASASVEFLRPVCVGDELTAHADLIGAEGKQRTVRCTVEGAAGTVLRGELRCIVPRRHVLESREGRGR